MRPVSDLTSIVADRPALVLGKGPSLSQAALRDYSPGACVIGINQTVRTFDCEVAFFIDIEPFLESCEELLKSNGAVVLPWHPNRRTIVRRLSRPMSHNLMELSQEVPALRAIREQGRLFYFHTRFADRRHTDNVFEPNLISFSALLQILGSIGVRDVRTLGVDGGTGHSTALKGSLYTQLPGGYDKQFPILRRIAMTSGIKLTRADAMTINVFIGCETEQWLPARVLEYTILKNTSERVVVRQLHDALASRATPVPGRTPFSCQRFFIPELCNRDGLAVYLDSDMQVFADIRELMQHYEQGVSLISAKAPPGQGRPAQFSVMVINCALARWDGARLTEGSGQQYEETMFDFGFEPNKRADLPYTWNSLELYEPGQTRLLHYTDMDRQPWTSNQNPLARIWVETLCEAVRDGFISFDDVRRCVAAGHVRPGLLYQIETGEADPRRMPRKYRVADELYVAPHTVARFTHRNNRVIRAGLALARKVLRAARAKP